MRSFLIGLYSGLLLSALRAPSGLELLQIPATEAGAAMAYRGAALLVIALGLILGMGSARVRFSSTTVLLGAAVGFPLHWTLGGNPGPYALQMVLSLLLVTLLVAGHQGGADQRPKMGRILGLVLTALAGWFLIDTGSPQTHGGAVFVGLVGLFALTVIGRFTGGPPKAELSEEQEEQARIPSGSLTGIGICGAGLAYLLEGIARNLDLLGGGLSEDDSVFSSTFLIFCAVAAVAFARSLRSPAATQLGRGIFASLGALAAFGAHSVLQNLSGSRALESYLRRTDGSFGDFLPFTSTPLDLSTHGMIEYDLAVGAPILILPAFVCGTLIALHRKPMELAALLIGGAVGSVWSTRMLELQWESPEVFQQSSAAAMAFFGATLIAIGALFALFTTNQLGRVQRLIGVVAAFAAIGFCRFTTPPDLTILSPWQKRDVQALITRQTTVGLVTVERDDQGQPFATLNRQAITPPSEEALADAQRIKLAWSMLGEVAEGIHPTVLLVGQLDMGRALTLSDLGAGRIDRTAAWYEAMPMLEHELFEGNLKWVPGNALSLADARANLDRGEYDLVIVPAVAGNAPTTRNLASPVDTTVVVWLDAAAGVADQHMGAEVIVNAPGLSELFVAIAKGPQVDKVKLRGGVGAPGLLPIGDPLKKAPAMHRLLKRERNRDDYYRARLADRLASAEKTPSMGAGLALHFHEQAPSSPFASETEAIELNTEAGQRFGEAAAGADPNALVINVIETLAYLYGAQRKIEEIDQHLMNPAARHKPWPALEMALAQASLEFLEPESALEALAVVHGASTGGAMSYAMEAEAHSQLGDYAAAVVSLDQALKSVGHHPELEQRLAIALIRAGDPRGPKALEHALQEAPEDSRLLQHQEMGPYPAAPGGYHPLRTGTDDGHGH
jgi:hypothetical protein